MPRPASTLRVWAIGASGLPRDQVEIGVVGVRAPLSTMQVVSRAPTIPISVITRALTLARKSTSARRRLTWMTDQGRSLPAPPAHPNITRTLRCPKHLARTLSRPARTGSFQLVWPEIRLRTRRCLIGCLRRSANRITDVVEESWSVAPTEA